MGHASNSTRSTLIEREGANLGHLSFFNRGYGCSLESIAELGELGITI